ncbi:hypothetical protein GF389_03420 [Candidatus Dojkabacteria bacterium]|nr:hypothetical protein [Candidatus Dojkabacteria bacterium]
MNTKKLYVELVGWYGTISIVGAYALLSFDAFSDDNVIYQLLNLTGALSIVLVSFTKKAYQPAVLNIVWAIIAILAILQTVF